MGLDVNKQHFISCKNFDFSLGTWTYSNNGGLPRQQKTAADETAFVSMLINIPKRANQYGLKINAIHMPYIAATADLDALPTATLYQASWMSSLVVGTPAATIARTTIPTTIQTPPVTANAGTQKLVVSVTSPAFENLIGPVGFQNYVLSVGFNAGATTVLSVLDGWVEYEEVES